MSPIFGFLVLNFCIGSPCGCEVTQTAVLKVAFSFGEAPQIVLAYISKSLDNVTAVAFVARMRRLSVGQARSLITWAKK
jgi:hypothetical protein